MYIDTLLFIISAFFALVIIFVAVYFLISFIRNRAYNRRIEHDNELFNIATASLFNTSNLSVQSSQYSYHSKNFAHKEGGRDKFNPYSFAELYTIEREIGGGAMSRTFEVVNNKLGNRWFMKYIPRNFSKHANEIDILKLLNHTGLPRIVDIFHRDEGDYLVETLIEGFSLKEMSQTGVKISQTILLDWFVQITQALNYLHNIKPLPIYHLDLKPGNIMVTHDNRLVLVDFGIARRSGDDSLSAFTAKYAAPEQFKNHSIKNYATLIYERFGDITTIGGNSKPDARTDIYNLGVIMFELATGQLPASSNIDILIHYVPRDLCNIIQKCLAIDPAERYQSTNTLLRDLGEVKGTKFKVVRMMLARKIAAIAASLSILISGGTFVGGIVVYNEENAAIISVQPEVITVSLQQSSDFTVRKQMTNRAGVLLDNSQIVWDSYDNNIARIDGNRVSGINEGITSIRGKHRNKEVEITVRVVQPVDGLINVSQQYETGRFVSLLTGTQERIRADGPLSASNFISPESITLADDGTVFIADAGEIRIISGELVSTLDIPIDYIKASMVKSFKNELYILSEPWQDGDRFYYAIVRIKGDDVETLYIADARYTAIEDYDFCDDGLMYFIDRNEGLGNIYLKTLDINNVENIKTLSVLPSGSASLAIDNNGYVFIGNKELGVIYIYRNTELEYFSGIEGERAFIDGSSPRFYSPQRLEYSKGYLYVWDFNTLRRIELERGIAGECITIVGTASPYFEPDINDSLIAAEDVILPFGSLMDFAITDRGILLIDHKRGVIWEII